MDQAKIGRFLAQLRKERNLTQAALGERLGVTNKTISRWENGNYMPDVEMLLLLSREFQVSVNELLCAQRLDDQSFRSAADQNLAEALRCSPFSCQERMAFWKKKWLREHWLLLLLWGIGAAGVMVLAWNISPWLAGLYPLVLLVLYGVLRNRMMIYMENRVFGSQGKENGQCR